MFLNVVALALTGLLEYRCSQKTTLCSFEQNATCEWRQGGGHSEMEEKVGDTSTKEECLELVLWSQIVCALMIYFHDSNLRFKFTIQIIFEN